MLRGRHGRRRGLLCRPQSAQRLTAAHGALHRAGARHQPPHGQSVGRPVHRRRAPLHAGRQRVVAVRRHAQHVRRAACAQDERPQRVQAPDRRRDERRVLVRARAHAHCVERERSVHERRREGRAEEVGLALGTAIQQLCWLRWHLAARHHGREEGTFGRAAHRRVRRPRRHATNCSAFTPGDAQQRQPTWFVLFS